MNFKSKIRKFVSIAACCGILAGTPAALAAPAAHARSTSVGTQVVAQKGAPILSRAYTGLMPGARTTVPAGQKLRVQGVFGYSGFDPADSNRYIFKATLMEKGTNGTAKPVKDASDRIYNLDIGAQLEVIKAYTRDQFVFSIPTTAADEGKEYFVRYEVYDTDNNFVSTTFHDSFFQTHNDFMQTRTVTNDILVDRFDDTDTVIKVLAPAPEAAKPYSAFSIDEEMTGIGGADFTVLPRLEAGCGYKWNGISGNLVASGTPGAQYDLTATMVTPDGKTAVNYDGKALTKTETVTMGEKGTCKWRWFLNASLGADYQDKALHLIYEISPKGSKQAVSFENTDEMMYVRPFSARGTYNALINTDGSGIRTKDAALKAGEESVITSKVSWSGLEGDTLYTLTTDLMDCETNTAIPGMSKSLTFTTVKGGDIYGETETSYTITPDADLAGRTVYLRYRIDGGEKTYVQNVSVPAGIHISSGVAPIDGRTFTVAPADAADEPVSETPEPDVIPGVTPDAGETGEDRVSSVGTASGTVSADADRADGESAEAPSDEDFTVSWTQDGEPLVSVKPPVQAPAEEQPAEDDAEGIPVLPDQTDSEKEKDAPVTVQCWNTKIETGSRIQLLITAPEDGMRATMVTDGMTARLDSGSGLSSVARRLTETSKGGKSYTVLSFDVSAKKGSLITFRLEDVEVVDGDTTIPVGDIEWTAVVE